MSPETNNTEQGCWKDLRGLRGEWKQAIGRVEASRRKGQGSKASIIKHRGKIYIKEKKGRCEKSTTGVRRVEDRRQNWEIMRAKSNESIIFGEPLGIKRLGLGTSNEKKGLARVKEKRNLSYYLERIGRQKFIGGKRTFRRGEGEKSMTVKKGVNTKTKREGGGPLQRIH